MKKLVLVALVGLFSFATILKAQNMPDPSLTNQKGAHKGERKEMIADLKLTDEQKVKFKAANDSRKSKIQALKAQNLPKDQKRAEMKKINDDHKANLSTFLSQEQRDKLEAKKEAIKDERKAERKAKKG